MSRTSQLLLVDAAINLALGLVLFCFPSTMVQALGLPDARQTFYPSLLGAVLIGIAVALVIESRRTGQGFVGLGLGGAVAINLCGGLCLSGWLLFGGLAIPRRGRILLWVLAGLLVAISAIELLGSRKMRGE